MIRRSLPTLALLAALAIAGCRSEPVRYYTLVPPAPPPTAPADPTLQFTLAAIDIPPQVDVPQLVVRSGGTAIDRLDTRRWIAPLADELHDALAAGLRSRLGALDATELTPDPRLPLVRLRVAVRRFDAEPGRAARLDASWHAESARDEKLAATCEASISQPVAAGYDALVDGQRQVVAALAARIAAAVAALKAGDAAGACAAGG